MYFSLYALQIISRKDYEVYLDFKIMYLQNHTFTAVNNSG